ncbi:hypothetical protein C8R41DRAFT_824955 [Lentinula lateritia]|uniref:Uncharacterized protein n=1 Tax=Lentinula lateritia TaxID=40482 RepID=A0ABQ8VKB7_9AGAR|nr:hypothetical protein C8R41DRAFT_824955 [Lentinula lateritia]
MRIGPEETGSFLLFFHCQELVFVYTKPAFQLNVSGAHIKTSSDDIMKCSSAASALILASLSISAFDTYAAPVSIFGQNMPSVPSTPSTPNPVPFPPSLRREEITNSPRMLAEDTSAPEALEIRHFTNRERYPRANDADSKGLKVDEDEPSRSSTKSSKKSRVKDAPEAPAQFADPQTKESSRKSSKLKKTEDAHGGKPTNTHRHKKTHKSGPPVVAETINESPIENSLDIQSEELSSPAPVIRKRPKKLKPSAEKNDDESLPFGKSSKKPSYLTLSATSQRTSRKPKPIPPKPKTPNSTDGYFYAQNTTAAFNSASSSSATNANAFAVNDGNFGGGNVAGIGKPPEGVKTTSQGLFVN